MYILTTREGYHKGMTVMINIHGAEHPSLPFPRAEDNGALKLWLYALTCILVLLLALIVSSAHVESQSSNDVGVALVQLEVLSYTDSWNPEKDPLVAVQGDSMAKRSNVEGVVVDGVRYYYRMPNGPSFDPVSLGKAKDFKVLSVMDTGTPWEVVIYHLAS